MLPAAGACRGRLPLPYRDRIKNGQDALHAGPAVCRHRRKALPDAAEHQGGREHDPEKALPAGARDQPAEAQDGYRKGGPKINSKTAY